MKDCRGREVLIGATVVYAASGGLVTATVTDFADGKATLSKDDGSSSHVTWKDEKVLLVTDPTMLA